jgi:hypothetical protein
MVEIAIEGKKNSKNQPVRCRAKKLSINLFDFKELNVEDQGGAWRNSWRRAARAVGNGGRHGESRFAAWQEKTFTQRGKKGKEWQQTKSYAHCAPKD